MNEQLTQTLQQQLRDIHLPDAVSWWPFAIGWWLVIITIIALSIWGLYRIHKWRRLNRYRQLALNELGAQFLDWQTTANTSAYLHSANALLKRTVQHIDPNAQNAHKTGQPWVDALNTYVKVPLSSTVVNALTVANYQPNPSVDVANLHTLLCAWFEAHQRNTQTPTTQAPCKEIPKPIALTEEYHA